MTEPTRRRGLILPSIIIAMGVGWLLTSMDFVPGVDWIWVVCLGVAGVLIVSVPRLNRITVIVGPFLIIASILSYLRQTDRLPIETEIPVLVIVLGLLMLTSNLSDLPDPPRSFAPASSVSDSNGDAN